MVEDGYYDSGDRRLLRLGIDPDEDPLVIWLELKKRMTEIDHRKAELLHSTPGSSVSAEGPAPQTE